VEADIALAPVNDMAGLAGHPHLRRVTVDTPGGPVSFPAPAPMFADEIRAYGPVPPLNEI
jgi:crotonobetainyl-CoA:carnitine CoA-transferase CaiB-like acyl-CoA transferase